MRYLKIVGILNLFTEDLFIISWGGKKVRILLRSYCYLIHNLKVGTGMTCFKAGSWAHMCPCPCWHCHVCCLCLAHIWAPKLRTRRKYSCSKKSNYWSLSYEYQWHMLSKYLLCTKTPILCCHFVSQIRPHCLPLDSSLRILQEFPTLKGYPSLVRMQYKKLKN